MTIFVILIVAIAITIKSFFVKAMLFFAAAILASVTLMRAVNDPFFWLVVGVIAAAVFTLLYLKRRKKRLQKEKEKRNRERLYGIQKGWY